MLEQKLPCNIDLLVKEMSRVRLPFLLGAGGYGVGKSIEYHLTDVNTDSEAKGSLLKQYLIL